MAQRHRDEDVMQSLHRVMQMYSEDLSIDRVKQAFLSLIKGSDAVGCSMPVLTESDIEQLTDAVMKCLYLEAGDELRIPVKVGQSLARCGMNIDYYDAFNFLEMHSEDIFGQATSHGHQAQAIAEVDQMWVGIALRYRYCAVHERFYFPVSAVIELREVVRRVSNQPDCGDVLVSRALETLGMLERNLVI